MLRIDEIVADRHGRPAAYLNYPRHSSAEGSVNREWQEIHCKIIMVKV